MAPLTCAGPGLLDSRNKLKYTLDQRYDHNNTIVFHSALAYRMISGEQELLSLHKLLINLPELIETERLTLRPFRAGDGAAYFEICRRNKTHLLPYEADNPALKVHSLDEAEALVRQFAIDWMSKQAFFLGAWKHSSNEFVAQIYIGIVSWELPEFEIGYFVDCDHEGKGFVTEAVRAAQDFCFTYLHAHRLRLGCNETNVRSWKVAERCGFKREGHIREVHPGILCEDKTFSGDYVYGLLRTEYVQQSQGE